MRIIHTYNTKTFPSWHKLMDIVNISTEDIERSARCHIQRVFLTGITVALHVLVGRD
jgi:hypothetical protein